MPNRPCAGAAATWRIHSVPIRSRDGLERLDQVYRRLLEISPSALFLPPAELDFGAFGRAKGTRSWV